MDFGVALTGSVRTDFVTEIPLDEIKKVVDIFCYA